MASHGSDSDRRVAYRVSTPREKNGRVLLFYFEQCAMGHLGGLCGGLRTDRAADLSLLDEPTWV